jgi:hypothetical protein
VKEDLKPLTEEPLAQVEPNLRKGVEAARKGRKASDQVFDEMFPEGPSQGAQ